MPETKTLGEESPAVQAHLGIMQSVIQRMATNSTSSKAWCVTLVSAILVVIADKGKPNYAWIAAMPTVLFFVLDAYYLTLEKGFRESYNRFVDKLHRGEIRPIDTYAVAPSGPIGKQFAVSMFSLSILPFYSILLIMIVTAKQIIFK